MTYRKNTRLGTTELARLNDDGSISVVQFNHNTAQSIGVIADPNRLWDNLYNNWQHINAREFNDAYNLAKENI